MSDQRPNVIVVKVHRNAAGYELPFDKLYFFRREDRDLIPKIFGYALVLPVEEDLLGAIFKLKPKNISHRKFRRDDIALAQEPQIKGELLDGRKHSDDQVKTWWNDSIVNPYDLINRVAVVPVLTSKVRKKLLPRYLSSQKWFDRQLKAPGMPRITSRKKRNRKRGLPMHQNSTDASTLPAISELAYLATPKPAPEDKIRPLCTICPRILLHLNGDCMPGQLVCYKALNLNNIDEPADDPSPKYSENDEDDDGDVNDAGV